MLINSKKKNLILIVFLIFNSSLFSNSYFISKINFFGNSSFSKNELLQVIKHKEPKLFSRSVHKPKKLKLDLLSIKSFYLSKGFLDVKVNASTKSNDQYNVIINFTIQEGSYYTVKNTSIFGNKFFTDDYLNLILKSATSIYDPIDFKKKIKLIKSYYLNSGFVDIEILSESLIKKNKIVNLEINISEGNQYSINEIKVNGSKSLDEKFILRELLFKENEIFNKEKIDLTRKRIFETGFFSSVDIYPLINLSSDNMIDIYIDLREYKLRYYSFDFGFDQIATSNNDETVSSVSSKGIWEIGNIFNGANSVGINAEANFGNNIIRRYFELIYRSPWILDFKFPTTTKLFIDYINDKNIFRKYGSKSTFFYIKKKRVKFYSNIIIENILTDDLQAVTDQERSIGVNYEIDGVDSRILPTKGYYFSTSASIYGSILGGERNYFKTISQYKYYFKLNRNIIFCSRFQGGYIKILDGSIYLPTYDRFFIGGQSSLRGWSNSDELNSNGGLYKLLVNFEARTKVYKKLGINYFYDFGQINQATGTKIYKPWNIGIGLTYASNLGPVRFDIASPYGNGSLTFHLSLLYMF